MGILRYIDPSVNFFHENWYGSVHNICSVYQILDNLIFLLKNTAHKFQCFKHIVRLPVSLILLLNLKFLTFNLFMFLFSW